MADPPDEATRSARELARRTGVEHHDVLVILGTGLAPAVELLGAEGSSIALDTLPFFPPYTATGHHAQGWSVPIGSRTVLLYAGRTHAYEGLPLTDVVHPLLTGVAAGCQTVILTAAVGAVDPSLVPGSIVVVSDQINLTGRTPLVGPDFVDMVGAYDAGLRDLALATPGLDPATAVSAGVYAQVLGPQFETPAEVAMLRTLGADVVGMSMALETIAARSASASVLGLAVVTNQAAGQPGVDSDEAVIARVGAAAAPAVAQIIRHVVSSLP
jgi:purine-nucleoside phosphorylase